MSKPLPVINNENRIFWNEAKNHRLMIQECHNCKQKQFYPRFFCTNCHSNELDWLESSGTGEIYSFTIIRRAPSEAFSEDVPYILALIELDEGVRMMSRIVDCEDFDRVSIGQKVKVKFENVNEEINLPVFTIIQ